MYRIEITGNTMEEVVAQLRAWDGLANRSLTPPSSPAVQPPVAPAAPVSMPAPQPQYAAPGAQQPQYTAPIVQQPIPTAAPAYTANDLMTAGAQLMARVGMPAMQQLLARFGVPGINQLPPERYGEFAQALRDMGGTI